jgi:hypothetical protein
MKFSKLIDLHCLVKGRLFYDEGSLYWRDSGEKAGWVDEVGYNHIRLEGKLYLEHRLIYLLHHCTLPPLIDHIDRNPLNNRLENLRGADKKVNAINSGLPANNKSGVKGVSWHKAGQKWTAQIKNDGVKIHLGSYDKLQDAVEARLKAEEDLWGDIR